MVPKLVQAFFAAICDFHMYIFALRLMGARVARWVIALGASSWFAFYALPRTLSSSLECSLIAVALAYWPILPINIKLVSPLSSNAWVSFAFAAASITVRPPALLLWVRGDLSMVVMMLALYYISFHLTPPPVSTPPHHVTTFAVYCPLFRCF